eukprot:TRINITY_DN6125_c0_g1_i3.p2 TRINITY_DN6125_c0_g1~~TRINITY_DN6125_c0_g1_i3.p2  ORF type:complete len:158 (-),score=26.01 TRINITY_DN6125_c0_g1_i3:73-546(-)
MCIRDRVSTQSTWEICGALQAINDTEKRILAHIEGKLHTGFKVLREEQARLLLRREEIKANIARLEPYEPDQFIEKSSQYSKKIEPEERDKDKGRDKDRERSRKKSRDKKDKSNRHYRHRSRSHSKSIERKDRHKSRSHHKKHKHKKRRNSSSSDSS